MTGDPRHVTITDLVAQAQRGVDDLVTELDDPRTGSHVPLALVQGLEALPAYARSTARMLTVLESWTRVEGPEVPGQDSPHRAPHKPSALRELLTVLSNQSGRLQGQGPLGESARAWGGAADIVVLNTAILRHVSASEIRAMTHQVYVDVYRTASALMHRCADVPDTWIADRKPPQWAAVLSGLRIAADDRGGHEVVQPIVDGLLGNQGISVDHPTPLLNQIRQWQALANGVLRDPHVGLLDIRAGILGGALVAQFAQRVTDSDSPAPASWPDGAWRSTHEAASTANTVWRQFSDELAQYPGLSSRNGPNRALLVATQDLRRQLEGALAAGVTNDDPRALVKAATTLQPILIDATQAALNWSVGTMTLEIPARAVVMDRTQLHTADQFLNARRRGLNAPVSYALLSESIEQSKAALPSLIKATHMVRDLPPVPSPDRRSQVVQD